MTLHDTLPLQCWMQLFAVSPKEFPRSKIALAWLEKTCHSLFKTDHFCRAKQLSLHMICLHCSANNSFRMESELNSFNFVHSVCSAVQRERSKYLVLADLQRIRVVTTTNVES